MPFGSVLANAEEVTFTTADDKTVTIKGWLPRMGLRLLGIPHVGLRVRARAVLEMLDWENGGVILDAGCGSGTYAFTLGFQGNVVYGVDMDKKKIEQCHKMSEQMGMGARCYFFQENILKLPFDNNMFDRIIFSECMEHIKDDQSAINELWRVLKPGGEMVISVPSDIFINQKFKEAFGHERLYTIEMIQKLVKGKFEVMGVARRNKLLGQIAWSLNRMMFFNKALAAITFLPIYALTYIDWYGPGRELIVKVKKV